MTAIPIPDNSMFPIGNLPLGVGQPRDGDVRAWVAIGDSALDLRGARTQRLFDGIDLLDDCFNQDSLNAYLSMGPDTWSAVRGRLTEAFSQPVAPRAFEGNVVPRAQLQMSIPTRPRDFVDFYSSIHHATNLGRLFRPDGEALMPNWRRIPIGYHGRTGTLLPDKANIRRPSGYRIVEGDPQVGPSLRLDIELEVGTVVGVGSETGEPIDIEDADQHLFGMCLVNDWSARDIQAYEYQPLGPFLGKSFATSVSPWLVSFEALEPFRVAPPVQEPAPAAYLSTKKPWGFDLHLEVWMQSAKMRAAGLEPVRITKTGFADMYWTPAQQLAHMTVNGASTSAGDLFASGTVSGPDLTSAGSFIELGWNGERPIELPDGSSRAFLHDGDRIELRGVAGSDPATRIGLGSVAGTIVGHEGVT